MWARRIARRWLPRRLRAELALLRRAVRDRRSGVAFALGRGERDAFHCAFEGYELPVIVYPGQERLAEGKRRNQRLMAEALDGARAEPGETLSLWRLAGRPSARRGYLAGAAIVNGRLTAEIGGATCLLSTVLYNVGLLAGLEVAERHAHSVDSYGEARYFEPGRDAAVEYGVLDLRFRNPHPFPVLLAIEADEARVRAAFLAPRAICRASRSPSRVSRRKGGSCARAPSAPSPPRTARRASKTSAGRATSCRTPPTSRTPSPAPEARRRGRERPAGAGAC